MTVFSKTAMSGASDPLHDVMSDIIDKAQQLAKDKIVKLLIAANQPTGPPMITNPLVRPVVPTVLVDDKPVRKRTAVAIQQYADWDTREYSNSKNSRQVCVDAREKLRKERQMESAKWDMLVYKQMVYELKTVLVTNKDKKVHKALQMEICVNKDIIQMMIQLGVPDLELPEDIQLQISVDKSTTQQTTGSKLPRTRLQAMEEGNKSDKDGSKGGKKSGEDGDEGEEAINHSNCPKGSDNIGR